KTRPAWIGRAGKVLVHVEPREHDTRRSDGEADINDPAQDRRGIEEQAVEADLDQLAQGVRAPPRVPRGMLELDRGAFEAEPVEDEQEVSVLVVNAEECRARFRGDH